MDIFALTAFYILKTLHNFIIGSENMDISFPVTRLMFNVMATLRDWLQHLSVTQIIFIPTCISNHLSSKGLD